MALAVSALSYSQTCKEIGVKEDLLVKGSSYYDVKQIFSNDKYFFCDYDHAFPVSHFFLLYDREFKKVVAHISDLMGNAYFENGKLKYYGDDDDSFILLNGVRVKRLEFDFIK